jgi:FkbH-like protein
LVELWCRAPTLSNANFVISRFERLRGQLELTRLRVMILRSFTVEPIIPVLRASAFAGGIDLAVQVGDFNAYSQEVLDSSSALYTSNPDVALMALQSRDVMPELWSGFADLDEPSVARICDGVVDSVMRLVRTLRSRSEAAILLHSFESPPWPAYGVHDLQCAAGQHDAVALVNRRLRDALRPVSGAYMIDYAGLVSRRGSDRWHDSKKWLTSRLPIHVDEFGALAQEWMRFLQPLSGRVSKVLAVDLDNTLWGGVLGEDGIDGVRLGTEHPGAHFVALQRVLLDLRRRGILLAICSKNNLSDVEEMFGRHPSMLLKLHHFAAVRANWEDKASNIRAIAKELNVGVDAVAFLDDSPVERRWVRTQLPEVAVLETPADPSEVPGAVAGWAVFERVRLTEEDRTRSEMYAEERARVELQASSGSLEDFYRSLQMRVRIDPMTESSRTRVAQLTQKTNQFNVTTRRFSEQQVEDYARDPGNLVLALSSADRFGDNGLVGVAMMSVRGERAEIDNFLMSCRVIGRTIETAFLAALIEHARRAGAREICGRFVPSKKNAPARDFFRNHGFERVDHSGEGEAWKLHAGTELSSPSWIEVLSST